jgi:hypothetical protein
MGMFDSIECNYPLLGGENMKAWFSLQGEFEKWALANDCRFIRLWARKAWIKILPDFKLTHYILRKEIR